MRNTRALERRRTVLKAAFAFLAIYGVLMAAVFFWGAGPVEGAVNRWTAQSTAWALRLLGAEAVARGDVVESSLASIRIVSECTALYPAVIFAAAVLATPLPWKRKLWASLGLPVLTLVNLIRIVSLGYIIRWLPDAADTAHYVVWQSLMIFVTLLLWLLWAGRARSARETAHA